MRNAYWQSASKRIHLASLLANAGLLGVPLSLLNQSE